MTTRPETAAGREIHPHELLTLLSDAEKVSLTAGKDAWNTTAVPRLGIPSIRLGDGPHGIRRPRDGSDLSLFDSHPATCFPTAVTLGSTWDPRLVEEVGVALGREAADHRIGVLLGPGVNLKRTPVGGRNFEYFSEDPFLSSLIGAAWTRGVQSTGVGVSLKHFAANNTERRRYGIDAIVDERALRELYLASFESIVVDERPATVMAAYNQLNGTHCSENSTLLIDILRREWGFDGVVVSDWGAVWDRSLSIPAGNDLAMPGPSDDAHVLAALEAGSVSRAALDESTRRILTLIEDRAPIEALPVDLEAHHRLARRAAAAGTVLLKNDGVLPLEGGARVAVIGSFATAPRFQGAGSSHVVPTRIETLADALSEALGAASVSISAGYDRMRSESSVAQLEEAVAAARSADVAIVVVGLPEAFETEGVDREHMRLPADHDRLVAAVAAANPSTVVVLQNGSPVEMPWRDSVGAIVEGYLGGQASGGAMADVLTGTAEPGGRLAETIPLSYTDHPVSHLPNGPMTVEYRESLYVGYRYFDTAGEDVAFPFGHGLSYTSFDWGDVSVSTEDGATAVVRLTVTNTGERAGSDVVQVYVHDDVSAEFRPAQELRASAKVTLAPGASERVTLRLGRRAFSYWSAAQHGWMLEPGRFEIRLGASSRDIRWRGAVELGDAPATDAVHDAPEADVYRAPTAAKGFPAEAFEHLVGAPLPENAPPEPGRFTLDTAILDMQSSVPGRLILRLLAWRAKSTIGDPGVAGADAVVGEVVAQLNFRMLAAVSGGAVSRRATLRTLGLVNRLARFGRRRSAAQS
jgi:beta-glucosidase